SFLPSPFSYWALFLGGCQEGRLALATVPREMPKLYVLMKLFLSYRVSQVHFLKYGNIKEEGKSSELSPLCAFGSYLGI
ncbi:hypothetical protein V4Y02_23535, partial [Escherichia coli]